MANTIPGYVKIYTVRYGDAHRVGSMRTVRWSMYAYERMRTLNTGRKQALPLHSEHESFTLLNS